MPYRLICGLSTPYRSIFFGTLYSSQVHFLGLSVNFSGCIYLCLAGQFLGCIYVLQVDFAVCPRLRVPFWGLCMPYSYIFEMYLFPTCEFSGTIYASQVNFWCLSIPALQVAGQFSRLSMPYRPIFVVDISLTCPLLGSLYSLQVHFRGQYTPCRFILGCVYALQINLVRFIYALQVKFRSIYALQTSFRVPALPYRSIFGSTSALQLTF